MLSDAGGPESCDLDHPKRVEDCLPEVVFRGGWGGVVVWLALGSLGCYVDLYKPGHHQKHH